MAKKSGKKSAKAGKAAAAKPAKAERGNAVAAFGKQFVGDLPGGSEDGHYAATVRDRFHGKPFAVKDGWHKASGWRFRFKAGAFVEAIREDRAAVALGPETQPAANNG